MDSPSRLKVLVSAYACSPYQGSEPGVGWGFVSAMARRHDLWVIVEEEKFRADIERYLAGHPELRRTVEFIFVPKRRNRWLRTVWPPSYYWYYREWQERALEVARVLAAQVRFDLVHQLTMVGFREPGFLWTLGVPFVWGPIGGMGLFPWRFLPEVGARGASYYLAYNLYNLAQMRFLRRVREAARAAGNAGLVVATPEMGISALRYWNCRGEVIAEVGLPRRASDRPPLRAPGAPLSIVWSGQHTPGKALNLGLRALARLPHRVGWTLDVLGEGPLTSAWAGMATKLGIGDRCQFHGRVPRERALEIMSRAHVLLITSLHDLTSTVTVEALALGVPVVCPDHCGFAHVIDSTCGIKVPVTMPRQLIAGLADGIAALAEDEERRARLARGALERAREYDWEVKAARMDAVYRRAAGGQSAEARAR